LEERGQLMDLDELKYKRLDLCVELSKIKEIKEQDEKLKKNVSFYNIFLVVAFYSAFILPFKFNGAIVLISMPITYAISIPIVRKLIVSLNHLRNGYTSKTLKSSERILNEKINQCNRKIDKIIEEKNQVNNYMVDLGKVEIDLNKEKTLKRVRKR